MRVIRSVKEASEFLAQSFLKAQGRAVVLTGAGISTPQKDYQPITYQNFISRIEARRRYWARSFFGFPRIARAQPNSTHHCLAQLEKSGWISGMVTQNVDGLHQKAGSDVLEMHGTLNKVVCLTCRKSVSRHAFQTHLSQLNDGLSASRHDEHDEQVLSTLGLAPKQAQHAPTVRPDGDVDLSSELIARFQYPHACQIINCTRDIKEGILKPHVVFFGENIPEETKERSFQMVDHARCLLVIGSSVQVFSALRLVKRALENGSQVIILNMGPTRADHLEGVIKLDTECGPVLERVVNELK